jgi:hypothetical protein
MCLDFNEERVDFVLGVINDTIPQGVASELFHWILIVKGRTGEDLPDDG